MMGALRQKEYALVLSEYEEMVQASVAPDMLALNCIIEATAHSQGAQQARETLQASNMHAQEPALSRMCIRAKPLT